MKYTDNSPHLQERVNSAIATASPLNIHGGNSKAFLGHPVDADDIDISAHCGVISYEPTELVVTVRAGTPMKKLESVLAKHGQGLAFEPPHYGKHATVGGTIACNLSGPARPLYGAARDSVLGIRIINGEGRIVHFGGEVMKNVAGYDLSRLLTGSMGTLGIILDVSLKVLPLPEHELTLSFEMPADKALETLHEWSGRPLPISASSYDGQRLSVRLSGTETALQSSAHRMGGEQSADNSLWQKLREHRHPFFDNDMPLWRLSLPVNAAPPEFETDSLYEWGGALRWLTTDVAAEQVRAYAEAYNGHATLYRNGHDEQPFHPLDGHLYKLHQKLKTAMDPHRIFNPGRMYPEL
jgi:glycolate oxidase FAD binding subunit